jgi:hypothetical protein
MGLYVRDGFIAEIANSIAGQHSDYDESNELPSVFAHNIAKYTAETILPTEEQITSCGKVVINLVKMLGADANPDNPDAVQAVADAVTLTLFPYFKPLEQDQPTGFELPDV